MESTKLTEDQLSLVRDLYQVLLVNHVSLEEYLDTVEDFMIRYIKEYKLKPLPEDQGDKPLIEDISDEEEESEK